MKREQRVIESPYLTTQEAVQYLRLGSRQALYRLITEHALPHGRRGRLHLFDKRDLDAWVRGFGSAVERERHARALSPRR
jgi:excisionase family DNA binding protein